MAPSDTIFFQLVNTTEPDPGWFDDSLRQRAWSWNTATLLISDPSTRKRWWAGDEDQGARNLDYSVDYFFRMLPSCDLACVATPGNAFCSNKDLWKMMVWRLPRIMKDWGSMRTSESDTGVLRRTEKPNRKELGIRLVKWELEDRRILELMHACIWSYQDL